MIGPEHSLLDLERAPEQRLGRIVASAFHLYFPEVLERGRNDCVFLAVDLLAHAQAVGEILLRQRQIAGRLPDEAEHMILVAGLLVLGAVLADDQGQCAFGKLQSAREVAGLPERRRRLLQVLQLLGWLLCACSAGKGQGGKTKQH